MTTRDTPTTAAAIAQQLRSENIDGLADGTHLGSKDDLRHASTRAA
ncbi:hypothetical protein M1C59_21455 [Gordonia terrae]|nr:hypothetical protein [Gordonia terrae]UPW08579.1 hypothetical protein M1C59_21455 [Gordonia terrae]